MMDMYNDVSIRFRELVVLFVMRMVNLVSLIVHSLISSTYSGCSKPNHVRYMYHITRSQSVE